MSAAVLAQRALGRLHVDPPALDRIVRTAPLEAVMRYLALGVQGPGLEAALHARADAEELAAARGVHRRAHR